MRRQVYAQAGLSLCWSHIPHFWKYHVVARLVLQKSKNKKDLNKKDKFVLTCIKGRKVSKRIGLGKQMSQGTFYSSVAI